MVSRSESQSQTGEEEEENTHMCRLCDEEAECSETGSIDTMNIHTQQTKRKMRWRTSLGSASARFRIGFLMRGAGINSSITLDDIATAAAKIIRGLARPCLRDPVGLTLR